MKRSLKTVSSILCFFLFLFTLNFYSGNTARASQITFIRIALYHDVNSLSSSGSKESVQVSATGGIVFGCFSNGSFTELYSSSSAERYTVSCDPGDPNKIQVFGQSGTLILDFDVRAGNFQARPRPENEPQAVRLGDYYRGLLEFRRFPGIGKGCLTVINEVDVEEYLYSVVPDEMQATSHIEALKAQAVAARTFAYRHIMSPKYPYGSIGAHLSDATDSQVYRGYALVNRVTGALDMVEKPSSTIAVNSTCGITIKYNGMYIYSYYSSSNGGYTEAAQNVWGSSVGYLQANPDLYEKTTSSMYFWERVFTPSELRNIVLSDTSNAKDIGPVNRVEIIERAESGRPVHIRLTGPYGSHSIYNSKCRTAFSLNGQLFDIINSSALTNVSVISGYEGVSSVSPSNLYVMNSSGTTVKVPRNSVINGAYLFRTFDNASDEADSFVFIGRGWGHGVGMSQEGAKGMAEQGYKYKEILSFYYAGTVIE